MNTFTEMVRTYSNWKLQEKGNGKLTRTELANLREEFNKQQAGRQTSNPLKERVDQYKAWKLKTKGTDKITEKEFNAIKRSLKESKGSYSFDNYLANYKRFKELKEGQATKITYKELKMLKENWAEANKKGIRLREADMGAAPMPGDPNAAIGADPMAAGMGDPSMAGMADPTMAGAQDPSAALAQIAQIANGAMGGAMPGADPMAAGGMPPAGDPAAMGAMDPAAAGGAPLAASAKKAGEYNYDNALREMVNGYRQWKKANKGTDKLTEAEVTALKEEAVKKFGQPSRYQQIKSRIAERQQKIAALQEGYLDIPTTQEMGTLTSKAQVSNSHGGDHTVSEEQVKVPTPTQLANGYTSGAASKNTAPASTWPTKAGKKEPDLQGKGASQTGTSVKEAKTVSDLYVDRYFEPKLSFDNLKESMKNGLLG